MTTTLIALLTLLGQAAPKPDPAPAPMMAAAPQEPAKVQSKEKSWLTFYGFLRLDAFFDTDRPNSIHVPGWILSEDIDPEEAGEKDFSLSARLTRLGVDLDGPTVAELGDAKVTGKLEVDFYNLPTGNLTSNSREFLRMRHAYGKMDWGTFSLLFGQREDVISPLAPTPNNDLVMWGAGNLGDRRPQIRPEFKSGGLTVTGMIGMTGADDAQNLDATAPASGAFFDGEASGVPTLQGRLGYDFDGWVEKKKISIGVYGHWAKEQLDDDTTFANGEDEFTSTAFGADLTIWVHEKVWIKAEVWSGKNLDDVRGGIFQGVVAGEEIESKGGWVELGIQVTSFWQPVVGASMDDPDDEDLAATGRDKNLVIYFANRFRFGPLEFGVDYLNWTTEFVGPGIDDGEDNRFNVFAAFWY